MSSTRVALVGFGRIGRNLFRILYRSDHIRVAAISDIADPKALEYLLRFDTILGRFPDEVSIREGHLYAVGRQIPVLSGSEDPSWGDFGVDTVILATGKPRSRTDVESHLERGAKRVILCSPPIDPPDRDPVTPCSDPCGCSAVCTGPASIDRNGRESSGGGRTGSGEESGRSRRLQPCGGTPGEHCY